MIEEDLLLFETRFSRSAMVVCGGRKEDAGEEATWRPGGEKGETRLTGWAWRRGKGRAGAHEQTLIHTRVVGEDGIGGLIALCLLGFRLSIQVPSPSPSGVDVQRPRPLRPEMPRRVAKH